MSRVLQIDTIVPHVGLHFFTDIEKTALAKDTNNHSQPEYLRKPPPQPRAMLRLPDNHDKALAPSRAAKNMAPNLNQLRSNPKWPTGKLDGARQSSPADLAVNPNRASAIQASSGVALVMASTSTHESLLIVTTRPELETMVELRWAAF